MGLIYDNNEAQQGSNTTREMPLDLTGDPPASNEAESERRCRRRTLSDLQGETVEPAHESESNLHPPRSAAAVADRPEEPAPQAAPTTPGLTDVNALPDVPEQAVNDQSASSTEAEPVLEQAQPRSGRPRLTTRGPHAGVIEPPPTDTASNGIVDSDEASEGQMPAPKSGRPRLTPPVPVPQEPESATKSARPRLTPPEPASEEPPSTPKSGRPRLTPTAPTVEAPQSEPISGRPRVSAPAPQAETAEPRVKSHRRRLGEQKTNTAESEGGGQTNLDPARAQQVVAQLRAKQNLPLALAAGLLAMALSGVLWTAVTVTTNYKIGYMALAVGLLVGGAVRISGQGISRKFGWLGAGLSLIGCLLGNFLTNCVFIARETDLSMTAVLAHLGQNVTSGLGLMAAFHPLDLVFYGIALYEGYRFSFRRLTEARIRRLA